jgi:uncharacterized tellurite resistance protein B-like protein
MLTALRQFIARLRQSPDETHAFDEDDHRLAIAALLVHAVSIDGVVDEAEKTTIRAVLKREFDLSDDQTRELVVEARERDNEAVDLYTFTSVLKRALDEKGRKRSVEMLWEIVYADGQLHEFEDNLVWRVAELLGVSRRERLRLKRRVAKSQAED